MCNYKILAHNEDGYVILCHSCRHYQLAFGTMAVTFDPGEFKLFLEQVDHLRSEVNCNGFKKQKRIPVEIPCKCTRMILNYTELIKLHNLLDEATFEEEVELLLENLNLVRE
jgi:hypothetical protein